MFKKDEGKNVKIIFWVVLLDKEFLYYKGIYCGEVVGVVDIMKNN